MLPVIIVGSPMAPELAPDTTLPVPMEMEFSPLATAPVPMAIAFVLVA